MQDNIEKEVEICYDHYKESFVYLRKSNTLRDRYILMSLILITILFFQIHVPETSEKLSEIIIKTKIDKSIKIDFSVLNTIFLLFFMGSIIKYYQINLTIDRQYKYIHKLERKLTEKLQGFKISREGKSYNKNYPIVLWIVHRIYTIIFLMLVIIGSIVKLINEISIYKTTKELGFVIINGSILGTVLILTIFYLSWIHFKDFNK